MSRADLVFLHPSDELYGADRMLLTMLDAVPAQVTVQVWLPTDLPHPELSLCEELTARGVTVRHVDLPILRRAYRTPRSLARLAGRVRRTRAELRETAPRIVYCTTSAAWLGTLAARWAGVRTVLGHAQEIWKRSDRAVLNHLGARCDRVIAISDAVATSLPPRLAGRVVVVTNATPDPGPVPGVDTHSGPVRYLVASRWNGWKGHRTLLRAWELAGCPGQLTVLGGPPLSGDVVDVPALVEALSRPDSVTVVGEVSDTSSYVEGSDVMIVPSEEPEPFGLVAIEAFAAGRPVVASAAGGLADIVSDGLDGWLFPAGDAAALAEILRGLTRDDAVAAGARARETFDASYTVGGYAARWRDALADLAWPATSLR